MRDDETDFGRAEAADEQDGAEPAEGATGRGGASFDPTPYLRQLRGRGGGQDYLDVKWRLLWLRREHPDAEIMTEHVRIDGDAAIFKATVTLPTGGKATGYGSETASDFGDFIEKAETKAIGRALNALGYGAQFGERGGEEEVAPAARPVAAVPPAVPRPAPAPAPRAATPPPPSLPAPAVEDEDAPPVDITAERDRMVAGRAEAPAGAGAERPAGRGNAVADAASGDGPDADLADYSWSAFWPWARGIGLNGPKAVEGLIGRPTAGLTPAELRDLIVAARNGG